MTVTLIKPFMIATDHTITPAEVTIENFLTQHEDREPIIDTLKKMDLLSFVDYRWEDDCPDVGPPRLIIRIYPGKFDIYKRAILGVEKVSTEKCAIYEKELNEALMRRAALEKPLKEFVDLLNTEIKNLAKEVSP